MNAALVRAEERLQALRNQHEQATADANKADPSADRIFDLQEDIKALQADAYLSGKRANVTKLEAEIATARQAAAEVNAKREAAAAAVPVLAARIAEVEAEVKQLTLEHYTAAHQEQHAAYLTELAEFGKLSGALHGALAKVHARAIVLEQLAERLGLRGGVGEFVQTLLIGRLQVPMEVSPGTWYAVDAWEPVSAKSRPLHAKLVSELAQAGVDVSGPALVKPAAAAPSAPIEARPVRIVVDGQSLANGERGPHVGLVESLAH